MTSHARSLPARADRPQDPDQSHTNWIACAAAWAADWLAAAASSYAAAADYERLCGLSDGELQRRGFSRATLAHDLFLARERTEGR